MFRTIPFIRHRIRPQRNTKSILRFAVILVTKQKSPSDRFLFLALPSRVGEGFLAVDYAFANAWGRQAVHVYSGQWPYTWSGLPACCSTCCANLSYFAAISRIVC